MDDYAVRLEKMVRDAFALQKRGLMRTIDGTIVKIVKSEERPMSKRISFANIISPIEKGVSPHKYAVKVGGQFHSSHPSKRSAMAQAQDLLDDNQEDVSVKSLKDDDEDEQYSLRKSPRVKDEDEDDDDTKTKGFKDEDEDDDEDDDADDAKRKVRQFAKQLDEDDDDDEDEKKRKVKAFAKRLGIFLKDADEDDDSADDSDDDEMDDDAKRARGIHGNGAKRKATKKVSFASVVFPADIPSTTISSDIEDQPRARQPRVADAEGNLDPIGREYSDMEQMYAASGGLNVDTDPIPPAGAGPVNSFDTRIIDYSPQRPRRFMREGEGEVGRVGGEDRGWHDVAPNRGNHESYELLKENIEPSAIPVRLGDNWLMNPQASGIAPASGFRPAAPTTVLKSKRRAGLFRSVVMGRWGDMADSGPAGG
jgi:hypothetical protein